MALFCGKYSNKIYETSESEKTGIKIIKNTLLSTEILTNKMEIYAQKAILKL